MEDEVKIFVFVSAEIQELLADNQTDLVELLNREGIEVKWGFALDPTVSPDSAYKEPVSIIFASAALILALTPTISKVIAAISHKTVQVDEMVLIPVEDSQGNVVRDASGNPILHWVKRRKIMESSKDIPEESSMSLKGPMGLELTYSASPKLPDQGKGS